MAFLRWRFRLVSELSMGRAPIESPLRCDARLLAEVAGARLDDALLLLGGDFRKHGERQHRPARLLGDRQFALTVPEMPQALLKMHRHRVIDLAGDSVYLQMMHERIAVVCRHAHHVLIEDMA